MSVICILIWTLLCFTHGSDGQNVVLTQPAAKSVQLGQTVTIDCKASRQVGHWSGSQYYLAWQQKKNGEAHKALVTRTTTRYSGISSRFTGSGAGNGIDFSLTISGVHTEDAGVYYCQSFVSLWYTFGGGTTLDIGGNTRPTVTVLPPSSEDLQQGKATLVCLANKGFPSDWSLSWKLEGHINTFTWEEEKSQVVLQKDGLYSWSKTLRLPAHQWRKLGSVTCEATQGSQTAVTETLRRDQCSQY
uniref:Ig-like domain-containing protein n=1 Tax=Cyprinodon variegatus TaxID=28743 RepID=A0A3Q2E351_CYPVA